MSSLPAVPRRYHDRNDKPYLLDRHARIGPKGKAVEYGPTETILPVKLIYTLTDEFIFSAVVEAAIGNPVVRKNLLAAFREAKATKSLTHDSALETIGAAVAGLKAIGRAEALALVQRHTERILAPGKDVRRKRPLQAGARALERAARKEAVRLNRRHRFVDP